MYILDLTSLTELNFLIRVLSDITLIILKSLKKNIGATICFLDGNTSKQKLITPLDGLKLTVVNFDCTSVRGIY